MKAKIITISLCLMAVLSSMYKPLQPNIKVKQALEQKLDSLHKQVVFMLNDLESEQKTMANYRLVRHQFKQVEFLLAEIDQQFYLQNFNGAPLPKLEKNVPGIVIITPKGLQVIDEFIGDFEQCERIELRYQLEHFARSIEDAKLMIENVNFTNELIMHAIQHQLLRVYTMGITGFDTPGTLAAITDSKSVISGLVLFSEMLDFKFAKDWHALLEKNESYLKQNNKFNEFDRAVYYKEYWQPLYASCIKSGKVNNIKTWNEINPKPMEVNADETHLYSQNFFNLGGFLDFTIDDVNSQTIALGEKLFYDTRLSSTGTMSCASCHNPALGFSDGKTKSVANDGSSLERNAPGLINAVYTKGFFYDLRAEHLSQQIEHVIFNEGEFNTSLINIFKTLDTTEFRGLFSEAFSGHKEKPINTYTFKTALSAYITSLTNFNTSFDKYMRSEDVTFSKKAKQGYNLFMGKAACATCHFPPTFSGLVPPYFDDSETEVLGVPSKTTYDEIDEDMGRYDEKLPKDKVDFYKYSFKTTTARNTEKTAPYMHNGVFSNYEELMEFYNNGGGAGHNLDVPNQTLSSDSLGLTKGEINAIILFLRSL
jgi:cytochrome c peroxidase